MRAATIDLLDSLDPLPYRQRMAALARWAESAPDRAEVCADLRGQGGYERHLALVAAMVVRDAAGIAAATQDPQPTVRAVALRAAVRGGTLDWSDADPSAMERRLIYRTLRKAAGPMETADALIAEVRSRYGDAEAAALLPACTAATVEALLPDLEHALDLRRLARRHPALVLDRVHTRLAEATPEVRERIWAETAGAVLRCDPAGALDLLDRYAPGHELPGDLKDYGVLAAHDPARVVRLLAAPGRGRWLCVTGLPGAVLRRIARLPTEALVPLARALRFEPFGIAELLDAVPPGRRTTLYARADAERAIRLPSHVIMDALPHELRISEARRVLDLPEIRQHESLVREWSAYLPWPEATAALADGSGAGDAAQRTQAYALLVDAARRTRDRAVVVDLVHRLDRLRNEQDPVRAAALTALTKVAPLLSPAAVAGLTRLATAAAEARDASPATAGALSRLAADTLQHHVDVPELCEWALATLDRSTGTRVLVLPRFDQSLRGGQEHLVVERLRGWVTKAAARGQYGPLFALTHALGRRAWQVPDLQAMLRRAIGPDTLASVGREAVRLWLDDPASRSDRVAEVLDVDATAVVIPEVWAAISSSRTDLLDRVFKRRPRGRFVEAGLHWVPPAPRQPQRWLPRQHTAFVALLELIVDDTDVRGWQRAAAIQAAARIPGVGRDLVLRRVDAADVVIAEAALGALVWTDRPAEALSVLLSHAGGDRARVALYAAERAARHVPPARLSAVLGPVLTGPAKVTSRKAAARMLARYGPPTVMATLRDAYADPETHRDVRAAVVAAARERLEVEESWTILAAAGAGSREEQDAMLVADPLRMSASARPRYAELIVAACGASHRETRRGAFGRLADWSRWVTGATELILDRLTDLGERQNPHEVFTLLCALDTVPPTNALVRLVERDAADDDPGGRAADRPARRRIEAIASGALRRSGSETADLSGLLDAFRWLAGQPGFTQLAARVLASVGRFGNLDELADLCSGRPLLAAQTAGQIQYLGQRRAQSLDQPLLRAAVARLVARDDLAGGLFAISVLRLGSAYGWPAPWSDLLLAARRHPDADVRELAYAVDMAPL